jgi:hypothetical protein
VSAVEAVAEGEREVLANAAEQQLELRVAKRQTGRW